ncbi:hypothetical protein B0T21DRAFT_405265 [Apiosordaria backusii]|uniref:DUF7924 domain-containing protein n=1 Tax=Apiosordaria backusii TaxID=314023 RepID=A0AA40A0U0_9PEZI|nr:hypothetical protein B0T21DRAFT_405265 [Apiosordaria backusii]
MSTFPPSPDKRLVNAKPRGCRCRPGTCLVGPTPREPPKGVDKPSAESSIQHSGRKRAIEDTRDLPQPSPKQRQISRPTVPETSDNAAADNLDPDDPIDIWRRGGSWAPHYREPDMDHLLARKRSARSLGGLKRSNSGSSATPSDQKPREEKSAQYRDQRYETLLATKGSFMVKSKLDVTSKSKTLCKNLLEWKQTFPENSLFCDDLFDSTCQKIHNRNEARVIQDISRLIVPSAESLATYGAKHLEILTESVNEGWNNSIPLTGTCPQSDYSVGFQRDAFTEEQLEKLAPFIGEFLSGDQSFFMATYYMYFPFLACEVKCGAAALDVADRQNAHSMTLAVRGVVELFRLVKRENEVNRQILSFSISHDHRSVRIYGYYPVIDGKDTKYYRHPIREFSFTEMDGKEKWTAYRFTKNVYDFWVPAQFKKICSAIDQLPLNIDFGIAAPSESTGLSQGLENLVPSEADSASLLVDEDGQSNKAGQMTSPATSFS